MPQTLNSASPSSSPTVRRRTKSKLRYDEFAKFNPMIPVTWRWDRARSLVETERPITRRQDDAPTCRAARFLRDRKRCHTERQVEALDARHQDIVAAEAIYREDGTSRWLIEAQLLAGQDLASIAHANLLPVKVVETYADLFFDVREHLDSRDYILLATMRKHVQNEVTPKDISVLLKIFAYFGGPATLDAVAVYLLSGFGVFPGVDPLSHKSHELAESIRRAIAAITAKITVPKGRPKRSKKKKTAACSIDKPEWEGILCDFMLAKAGKGTPTWGIEQDQVAEVLAAPTATPGPEEEPAYLQSPG